MTERIQKILSRAGIASRREAERMLLEGRVLVNGAPAKVGEKADALRDSIRVDGKPVKKRMPARITVVLNKPRGTVSTRSDPEGRPTVVDLVRGVAGRVYPVGRLDYDAEGLILLTNDGDLAYALLRPGGADRVYRVKVRGRPAGEHLDRIRNGMILGRTRTLPARARIVRATVSGRRGRSSKERQNTWLEVALHEGKRNQLVRMFRNIGHPILRLRRMRIGPLTLGSLPPGHYRILSNEEVAQLKAAASGNGGGRSADARKSVGRSRVGPTRFRSRAGGTS